MKKRPDSAKGYVEESDPYRTKSRDGKTILCHACGLAASSVKKLRIIGCNTCNHHFHLDCLDPPLVTPPPVTTKWVCPLHMDQTVPSHQVPKETKTIPINKPNTPNNGNIDVTLDPENRTKVKQIELIRINGVKYQVPENIIILDFWNKLAKGKDISNAEGLNPPGEPPGESSPSITTINDNSHTTFTSPRNSHVAPLTEPNPISVECHASPSSSRVSCDSPFLPPRVPTPLSTKSVTKQSKLTCLLQAAQQVNDIRKSVPDAGLILLGNTASLQSKVPSNLRVKPKMSKPSSKPASPALCTSSTRDSNPLQPRSCNPLQSRGCNRSSKSVPLCPETPDSKDTTKLKLSGDHQTGSNLNQLFPIAPFTSKHVDVIPSNNQATSLDKFFACPNQIIASPVHAGCQWTGPRHISLGPARSTIFMGQAGPGLYLKSLGPTQDPACGGPGSANGV